MIIGLLDVIVLFLAQISYLKVVYQIETGGREEKQPFCLSNLYASYSDIIQRKHSFFCRPSLPLILKMWS